LLARVRPAATLFCQGFDRVLPKRWFSGASIAESRHWMVLVRAVELAAFVGEVKSEQNHLIA